MKFSWWLRGRRTRWAHEHAVSLVRGHGAAGALRLLRDAIPPYNVSTGVTNTTTSRYHDTITVYYVWAIHRLLAAGLTAAEILADPLVGRTAALAFWDRDVQECVDMQLLI